jgi:Helix-turn-helix domain
VRVIRTRFHHSDGRPKTAHTYGQKDIMSFQAMTWAIEQECANAGQKLVLLMLANYCNAHTGQCNPSHKRLAQECCMGLSTLKRHLADLSDSGLLEIIGKALDGVQLPNQYMLKMDGVGQNRADPQPKSGGGVGPNRATNQEFKPGIEPSTSAAPVGFAEFWSAWPQSHRKGGKAECLKVWTSRRLEASTPAILAHVRYMAKTADWTKSAGEFIPSPLVYLRGSRWDGFDQSGESSERSSIFRGAI